MLEVRDTDRREREEGGRREGERERGRERGREGKREGGREGGRERGRKGSERELTLLIGVTDHMVDYQESDSAINH